jgi:hypothetical protein
MNQREVSVIYDHLVVFIRRDTAEIRGLVGLTPRQSQFYHPTSVFFSRLASDQERRLAGFPMKSRS